MPHYLLEAVKPCYLNSHRHEPGDQFYFECEESKLPSAAKVVKTVESEEVAEAEPAAEPDKDKEPETLKEVAESSHAEVTKSSKSKSKSQKGDS